MPDIEKLLNRWTSAGVISAPIAARILAWEAEQECGAALPHKGASHTTGAAGLVWQGLVALILGGILLATGVVLFVSAHWDDIGPAARFALVIAMVTVFHVGGALVRDKYLTLSTTLHAVGTISTGAAIAVVGQIFNIEEHWPAAILLWAIAALAGWALLHDQAQQVLTFLLFPAWMLCELAFYTGQHIGREIYIGRFLVVWAVFYLTMILGSPRRAVHGLLFAASAIAGVVGSVLLTFGWSSWAAWQTPVPFGTRFWAWVAIAALPVVIAAFKGHWGIIPPASAILFAILLPWCQRFSTYSYDYGNGAKGSYLRTDPNIAAHALVAAFSVFVIAWGMRQGSRALVNLGILYFAVAVAWFYFSNIFDKIGRSLGLIGLGVLFLAGGWALERTRRGLLARLERPLDPALEAK